MCWISFQVSKRKKQPVLEKVISISLLNRAFIMLLRSKMVLNKRWLSWLVKCYQQIVFPDSLQIKRDNMQSKCLFWCVYINRKNDKSWERFRFFQTKNKIKSYIRLLVNRPNIAACAEYCFMKHKQKTVFSCNICFIYGFVRFTNWFSLYGCRILRKTKRKHLKILRT